MNNKIIIALAVFSITILLAHNNIEKVFAFTVIDRTTTGNNQYSDIVDNTIGNGGCDYYLLTSTATLSSINCNNHAVTRNNIALPVTGTACQNNGVIAPCELDTGTFAGLECAKDFCYTTFVNATRGLLLRYDVSGVSLALTGWVIVATNQPLETGQFEVIESLGSFTVFIGVACSAVDLDRVIARIDGVLMQNAGVGLDAGASCAGASTGGNFGVNNINDMLSIVEGSNRYIAVVTNAGTANFRLFNLSTNSHRCTINQATTNSLGYDNDSSEWLLIAKAVSGDLVRVENDASCTVNGTVTDATMGYTGFTPQGVDVHEGRNEIYVNANNGKVHTINSTTYAKVWEFTMSGTTQLPIFSISSNSSEVVSSLTGGTSVTRFVILSTTPVTDSGSAISCIETVVGSGILDLCFTDTDGNGVADNGLAGSLGAYRSNANLTSFGTDLFCAFGINQDACTNKDLKTNGVGIAYLIVLIIISYAFLVFIHHQAQKMISKNNVQVLDSLAINPMLLLVMLILDVGFAFVMAWIPDLIFYTLVVVMAGFVAFGLYRKVTSSGGTS